jgi:outer membrane protein OmpA-like peptidoglycan-associated protein
MALMATATPAMAQQDACKETVDVYFESGSANLLQTARDILLITSGRVAACPAPLIIVVAHIDGAEAQTTPDIGQRRAEAVAAILRANLQDVPVLTQDLGFTQPRRRTAADVREPQNRRVTVFIR